MSFLSALELANLLYEMPTSNQDEITVIFEKYFQARHKVSKASVEMSRRTGIMFNRKVPSTYHNKSKAKRGDEREGEKKSGNWAAMDLDFRTSMLNAPTFD